MLCKLKKRFNDDDTDGDYDDGGAEAVVTWSVFTNTGMWQHWLPACLAASLADCVVAFVVVLSRLYLAAT